MSVKIAAAAPQIRLGDVDYNAGQIIDIIRRADADGAEVLVLPEMCITGATLGSLCRHGLIQEAAEEAARRIARETAGTNVLCFVGIPAGTPRGFESQAAVICGGELLGIVPTGQPDCFANDRFRASVIRGAELADPLPEAEVICCLADFPARAYSHRDIPGYLARVSRKTRAAIAIACPGRGESGTDGVYTGLCAIVRGGEVLAASEEGYVLASLDSPPMADAPVPQEERSFCRSPFLPEGTDRAAVCSRILDLQARALAQRMEHVGAKRPVVGVSGGLDSTLALLVSARAAELLGNPKSSVLAVTMPCFGTTGRTRSNAERLALALGAELRVIDIGPAVTRHFADIGHDPADHGPAYENAQARERTQVLMDLCNDVGGLDVGTGDLSELALGWCTYSGDHMSMYAVNAGLPKTVIQAVVSAYADSCGGELASVLRDILATPISPELLPTDGGDSGQRTEDIVGPYELHDFFLWYFVGYSLPPSTVADMALEAFGGDYDADTIKKWLRVFLRRFFASQFKRSCMPDGPAIFDISLSPRAGFAMPSDASARVWLDSF